MSPKQQVIIENSIMYYQLNQFLRNQDIHQVLNIIETIEHKQVKYTYKVINPFISHEDKYEDKYENKNEDKYQHS